jgi:hypothetical protein
MQIVSYFLDNAAAIIQALTAVVTACSLIAALTPTPKDDGVVKWGYKILDLLALNIGKAKDK